MERRNDVPSYDRRKRRLEDLPLSDLEVWRVIQYLDPDLDRQGDTLQQKRSVGGATIIALAAAALIVCVVAVVLHMRGL
jgi:hypothetical protein